MRRLLINKVIGFVRGSLCLLLAGGVLLRPAQLDAILIHSHGDSGGHVHAISPSEVGLYQQEHDRLHELEHAEAGAIAQPSDGETSIHENGGHSEECGAILVIFGEMKGATSSPRFDAAVCHANPDEAPRSADAAYDLFASSVHLSQRLRSPDSARTRPLDAILQSSHAILI